MRCGPAPHAIAQAVDGAKVVDTEAVAGGGSLPGLGIPSIGIALEPADSDRFAAVMRDRDVVARVTDGAVVCDLRTVDPIDDPLLLDALQVATRDADT